MSRAGRSQDAVACILQIKRTDDHTNRVGHRGLEGERAKAEAHRRFSRSSKQSGELF